MVTLSQNGMHAFIVILKYPSITFRMRFKAWFRSFQTERLLLLVIVKLSRSETSQMYKVNNKSNHTYEVERFEEWFGNSLKL